MGGFKVIDKRWWAQPTEFQKRCERIKELYDDFHYREFVENYKKYWHSTLLVDDKTVIMTAEQFKELPEYSCSMPTGVYAAKRWKRDIHEPNRYAVMQINSFIPPEKQEEEIRKRGLDKPEKLEPKWFMGEYKELNKEELLTLWREIIIV